MVSPCEPADREASATRRSSRPSRAVVTEVGPSGLTLAAMADRVGLSAPALTQRFGSKRSLLLAHAEAAATGIEDPFNRARSNSPTALSALRAALLELTAGIDSRDAIANHLALLHLDLTDPELGAHAAKQSRLLRRAITQLLERGDQRRRDQPHRCRRARRHRVHRLQRRPRHLGHRRHREPHPVAIEAARPRPRLPPTGVTFAARVQRLRPLLAPGDGGGRDEGPAVPRPAARVSPACSSPAAAR